MAEREVRTLPIAGVEWRESGAGEGQMTVRGHAAVYDRTSLDLGGFREKIAKGAFSRVLDGNPDVHALWDHDTKFVLARTKNKTLELREDPVGLHFWARVADTSYAKDLRVLMERGDIDQASFAFTVKRDEWHEDDEGRVTRTILEVEDLYDVTVTAMGAYPQTDTAVVRSLRGRIADEVNAGHLPESAREAIPEPTNVTPGNTIAPDTAGGEDAAPAAPADVDAESRASTDEQPDPVAELAERRAEAARQERTQRLEAIKKTTRAHLHLAQALNEEKPS